MLLFLDRLVLLVMLAAVAGVLTAAMVLQIGFGDVPCPLCLLQRVALFGCAFGLIRELRDAAAAGRTDRSTHRSTHRGTGIALGCAVLLLVIAARQTLLDIVPRPGHAYVGEAVLGLHMPVWSVVIAVALLTGMAARLALFGTPDAAPAGRDSLSRHWPLESCARGLELYLVALCALNVITVVLQCGLGACHTEGYRLLR
jgi:disulfide bond formation protein DsbB